MEKDEKMTSIEDFKEYLDVIFERKTVTQHSDEDVLVNHPPHYISNGMETIDVIEAFTSHLQGIEATDTGNILKYACRWKQKNGVEDLKKIIWYANHLIEHIQKKGEVK